MGYLHAKGIVHKDLKTKNVFLESLKLTGTSENFKVVITDFGLFSVTKLCHGSRLVPHEFVDFQLFSSSFHRCPCLALLHSIANTGM